MKLVILDRDGVINQDSDDFIKSPDEWKPIPGSIEAIARLYHAGFHVVIATNQSGIARALFNMSALNAIHEKMMKAVQQGGGRIDAIFFSPYTEDAGTNCRKPRPGMFVDIGKRYNVPLRGVPCVGDSLRDLQAASAVGGQPILVLTGKGQSTLDGGNLPKGTKVFLDLSEVAQSLINYLAVLP